jgi:hypothetical protein
MKRCDVPLRTVSDLVATCIVLYNLCITMNDGFNENWISKAEEQITKKNRDWCFEGRARITLQEGIIESFIEKIQSLQMI